MDNLRKRVGELQLDKNWKRLPKEQETCVSEEEKPLLKVRFIICLCNIVKRLNII